MPYSNGWQNPLLVNRSYKFCPCPVSNEERMQSSFSKNLSCPWENEFVKNIRLLFLLACLLQDTFESYSLTKWHLGLNCYRKHFPKHLILPVNRQPVSDIRMKQVCSCTTLNLVFLNSTPRISAWHFQEVPHSHMQSKEIFESFFANYKNVACNVLRPHTGVFPVPWVKDIFTYTFLFQCLQLISRQGQCSFAIPWNLIGGNPCWVTPTLNPLVPVIGQRTCQISYCSLISYFPVCAVLCTVHPCHYC